MGSSYDDDSSSPPPLEFSRLPVMDMRAKIVEKIMENRVTLIIGETGCGKSSQIPQFLLEENIEPVLCTQPRRFAVVAVARMVASARNCEVGGEVGYHIGHSRVFSESSKIVFKTAGVLLDEMLERGVNALKYKVIVLDEVHERSVESDLVLVCIKQFLLKNNDLRVVLMSATADISRYSEYFKDLGRGERVEVLAIPSAGKKAIFQRDVLYLEQVSQILGMDPANLSNRYCSGPGPMVAEPDMKPDVHKLIHDLVIHIHKNEPDMEKSILVFLPTYFALEQQWSLLKPFNMCFKIHILHSSIDTEQALKSMKILKSHRKVILATNIAESSVTIPKVGYVIDSCRSLQVFWDSNKKAESAELVWVSKSQAEQRRGRTGRTCDGRVYRLVTGPFFGHLNDYERPSILNLSLRMHVLQICCAGSRAINEPKALLRKAMDPPDPDVVNDALDLLVHMHALGKPSSRGRHEPTFYGQLLSSFSLSFDASALILKFGNLGMLHVGILLGILMDLQPLPILRPFGLENQYKEHTDNFYSVDKLTGLGKKEVLYVANLCAFQFWQRVYKDTWRLNRLKSFAKPDENEIIKPVLLKMEEDWCSSHNLILPALQQVAETYDEILSSLHRFRPKFLLASDGIPLHHEPCEFQHTCCLDRGNVDAWGFEIDGISRKCTCLPFVGPYDFQTDDVVTKFASVVKEMRMQLSENVPQEQNGHLPNNGHHDAGGAPLCIYFAQGLCRRGAECWFSHSLEQTKKPLCKFVFSLQGCRNGDSCFFSHDSDSIAVPVSDSSLCCPEDDYTDAYSLLELLPAVSDGCILLLDDTDLYFSSKLAHHYDPLCIVSTTTQPDLSPPDSLVGITLIRGSTLYETIMASGAADVVPWSVVQCVLWFPTFDDDHVELHKTSLQNFFNCLAIRFMADVLQDVRVVLTMNNLRFSKLQVEKLARESFFYLRDSFPFDEAKLGTLSDSMTTRKTMIMAKSVSYVFDMHLPADIQSGSSEFRQLLHGR